MVKNTISLEVADEGLGIRRLGMTASGWKEKFNLASA